MERHTRTVRLHTTNTIDTTNTNNTLHTTHDTRGIQTTFCDRSHCRTPEGDDKGQLRRAES